MQSDDSEWELNSVFQVKKELSLQKSHFFVFQVYFLSTWSLLCELFFLIMFLN